MRFPLLASSRRRARPLALAAATAAGATALGLAAGVPTAAAARAPPSASTVVSPRPGQRIRRHRVQLVVRAGDEHGDLRVTLNGRQIGRDFAPGRRGRRVAHVTVSHGLRHGRNVLRVRARHGYETRRATVRFRITRRLPLVGAGRDRAVPVGRPVHLRGHVRRAPGTSVGKIRWRVIGTPRGSRVRSVVVPPAPRGSRTPARRPRASAAQSAQPLAPLQPAAPAAGALPLSPLQPLLRPDVPGVYTLQVSAGSGASATTDTVQVSAIPADPLVAVDTQVAAASSSSGAAQPGIRVGATTHRMAYLGFENGSGRYAASGDPFRLGQFYAQWQVVALDRRTLAPRWNRTYGFCQVPNGTDYGTWRYCRSPDNPQPGQPYEAILVNPANEFMREAPGNGAPGALLVARTTGAGTPAGTPEEYDALLDNAGFPGNPDDPRGPRPAITQPTSFVGVPGMQAGEATVSARADGELPGFLTADQNYLFHFLSSQRPQFDTRSTSSCDASGCKVSQTFGDQQARATVPAGKGGYLVSGWDPVTGALRGSTFATIHSGDAANTAETRRLLATLYAFDSAGSLVAITTLRAPGLPAGSRLTGTPAQSFNDVATLVASFGGTRDGFLRSVTSPDAEYSLIGFAGAGEDGGREAAGTADRARLRGAFTPDRRSQLRPANVSSVGPAAERIAQMVVTPTSTDWRYPDNSSGAGAAMACIGAALGKGVDVRAAYPDLLTQADATALQSAVRNVTIDELGAVPGTGLACRPTAQDFAGGQAQLVQELGWVANVRGYLTALSTPQAAQGGAVWGQTLTLGEELHEALAEEDEQKEIAAGALGFVASILELLAPGVDTLIEDAERVTAAVETSAATFLIASEGIERAADGGPDLDPNVRAIDLAAHLQQKAHAATAAFTQIGDVIVSDPGKLQEVGRWARCTPDVPGGCPEGLEEYAATGADLADLTDVSLRSMGRTIYETLVTETYPTWDTGLTEAPGDPYTNFYCYGTRSPFGNAPSSAFASGLDSLRDGAPPQSRVYLMVRSAMTWGWPPAEIAERMFGETGDTWDEGGLGMDPLTVMRNSTERFEPGTYSCHYQR